MGNMAQEEESVKATPLAAMAEAFEELSKLVKTCPSYHLRLITFCDACSLVSVLFGCLGIAFKFAELEYVSKVLFFHLNRSLSLSLSLSLWVFQESIIFNQQKLVRFNFAYCYFHYTVSGLKWTHFLLLIGSPFCSSRFNNQNKTVGPLGFEWRRKE